MDFNAIMRLQQEWNNFQMRHQKVPAFLAGIRSKQPCVGQEIAVAIRYPDGSEFKTGIRVTAEDLALLETLKSIKG